MPQMTQKSFQGLSATGFHRVAYTEWGDPAAARTIVCVHGLTRNGRDFDVLAADLAETLGVRVVCPDVVGRGKSGRLRNPALYGYPQYLADMAALIARLDVASVDWVGTSMGGLIGMMLAAQPDTPIRRMVVNDVGPFVPKAALERIGTYLGTDPTFADMVEAEAYLRTVHAPFGDLTDAQWAHMARHGTWPKEGGKLGLAYDPAIAVPFRAQPPADVELWPVWSAVACPVLVVRGARSDLLLPDTAARMQAEGPKAKLLEVVDAGHAPALMHPDQIAAVRAFLADG